MPLILKFLGGLLGSLLAKAAAFYAAFRAGEAVQQKSDLEATQSSEQEAADAKARVATDPDFARRVRERYTADE